MLVSGGQILAIDHVVKNDTLVGDGSTKPLGVNTDVIATTALVSDTSSKLQNEINEVSGNFKYYYTKNETSAASEISAALEGVIRHETEVSAADNTIDVSSETLPDGTVVYKIKASSTTNIIGVDPISAELREDGSWYITYHGSQGNIYNKGPNIDIYQVDDQWYISAVVPDVSNFLTSAVGYENKELVLKDNVWVPADEANGNIVTINTYSSVSSFVDAHSGDIINTVNTYSSYSSYYNSTVDTVSSNSAKWDDTYTNLSSNSANWDNTYNTVLANSATWNEGGGSSDIELYSSDGSLSISGIGSAYDLKINEQLSAKNYFVTDTIKATEPLRPVSGTVSFGTNEPITDLISNAHFEAGHWVTSEIHIPKEMKLFNVKLSFAPNPISQIPAYTQCIFELYLDNTKIESFLIISDNTYTHELVEKNCLIPNPMSADSILNLRCNDDWFGWASICINDETYRSIGTSGSGIPDNYDSLCSTVSSNSANWDNTYNTVLANSATWNEGGGSSDIELYSSDGSLLISADESGYDLKLNEQLSAKNYFVTDSSLNYLPLGTGDNGTVSFGTNEPSTDLSSNAHYDEGGHWLTTGINIPKEMKLFNVKLSFVPSAHTLKSPTYRRNSFDLYLDNTKVDGFGITSDNMYNHNRIEKNCLIPNPMSADSILNLRCNDDWFGNAAISINDETYKSIGNTTVPDNYDSLYSTVSSNSASWNEGGGQGSTYTAGSNIDITNNTISGKDWSNELNTKLDTTAFALPSANWDNTYNTVLANSAAWNEGGGQGSTYTAGDAIDITDSEISVKYGKGLTVNASNALEVKAGNGLAFNEDTLEIEINNEVTDVVAAVEKLNRDLDTQITTNFDMPNISKAYDFADPSVSTLANGACILCQSFTIPINHEFRTINDDANTPTLIGIYAQQSFGQKIMLALYEYTYAKEGQSQGSTTYVGDTGPVSVVGGVNEFPLKNRNPSITELRCDKVYYATLYLPNAAHSSGLFLAGCPNYGTQSIPAEPRLTCALENITWNGQEIDMNDPTATLNHYQEVIIPDEPVYYQYHIGPWQSGYNERWSVPRFYMQIRNGAYNAPVVITEPFVDLDDALPTGTADMPSFTPSQSNSTFRNVTPSMNVTITAFEWIDCMQTAAQWAAEHCVYDSGFANNLSGQSNTVTELGQVGENGYAHRITFTTPITLTAGITYRFLCGCSDGTQQFKVWLDPTNIIHASDNGWYVDNYNTTRIEHQFGMYNKLHDNNNNSWVI